jgi:hypothetical protein
MPNRTSANRQAPAHVYRRFLALLPPALLAFALAATVAAPGRAQSSRIVITTPNHALTAPRFGFGFRSFGRRDRFMLPNHGLRQPRRRSRSVIGRSQRRSARSIIGWRSVPIRPGHRSRSRYQCRKVQKARHDSYGRPVLLGATLCHDSRGRPFIVAGSRHRLRRAR